MTEFNVQNEIKINENEIFPDVTIDIFNRFIMSGDLNSVLNKITWIKCDIIFIDYRYFKLFASNETYELVINRVKNNLNIILTNYDTFTVNACMKSLSITDAEKHRHFLCNISKIFKEEYPDKLSQCVIYNAPYIFARVFDIIRVFVDKPTQKKIIMI